MALPTLLKNIPEAEWARMRKSVEDAKGKLIVLVHPYFIKPHSEKYFEALEKLFSQKKTPIVVLEGYPDVDKLNAKLRGKNPVLIIPTKWGDSSIVTEFGFDLHYGKQHPKVVDVSMKSLSTKLHEIGVRTILVGGMILAPFYDESEVKHLMDYESDWLTKHGERRNTEQFPIYSMADGCVGATYRKLVHSNLFPTVRLIPYAVGAVPGELHTPDFRHPYSRPIRRRPK